MRRFVLSVSALLLAGSGWAADAAIPVPPEIAKLPVRVKLAEPVKALVLPMQGHYELHAAAFERLSEWMEANGVLATGPAFGRYFAAEGPLQHLVGAESCLSDSPPRQGRAGAAGGIPGTLTGRHSPLGELRWPRAVEILAYEQRGAPALGDALALEREACKTPLFTIDRAAQRRWAS